VLALCASCPPLYCPGGTCGDRGVLYTRTIVDKANPNSWCPRNFLILIPDEIQVVSWLIPDDDAQSFRK